MIDIVRGDQKAISRLVLALAAHFKPASLRYQQKLTRNISDYNLVNFMRALAPYYKNHKLFHITLMHLLVLN